MSSIPARAYTQYAIFVAVMVLIYIVYSIHSAANMDKRMLSGKDNHLPPNEEFRVESVLRLGTLVPVQNSLTHKSLEGLRLRSSISRVSGAGLPRLGSHSTTELEAGWTSDLHDVPLRHLADTEMALRKSPSISKQGLK